MENHVSDIVLGCFSAVGAGKVSSKVSSDVTAARIVFSLA
jgi:hypothetical protein